MRHSRCRPTVLIIGIKNGFTRTPLLGGNNNDPVCSPGAVKGSGGSVLQNGHRFDIIRIQSRHHIGRRHHLRHIPGNHRYPVDHIQRLYITVDRSDTANLHRSLGTRLPVGLGNTHPRHIPLQSLLCRNRCRFPHNLISFHHSGRPRKRLLLYRPISHHHNLLHRLHHFFHNDMQFGPVAQHDLLGHHSHITDTQLGFRFIGNLKGKFSVYIRSPSVSRSLHHNSNPGKQLLSFIHHRSLNRPHFLLCSSKFHPVVGHLFPDHDSIVRHTVFQICIFQHLLHHHLHILIFHRYIQSLKRCHILIAVQKYELGLLS